MKAKALLWSIMSPKRFDHFDEGHILWFGHVSYVWSCVKVNHISEDKFRKIHINREITKKIIIVPKVSLQNLYQLLN